MLDRPLTSFGQDGTIAKVNRESMFRELTIFNHFCTSGHCGFLEDVSLTFIDKTDPPDPLKMVDY